MDKVFEYVEVNKHHLRDQDYKAILDIIMEEKKAENKMRNRHETVKEKLHQLSNDYIKMSKAYLSLVLERDGYVINNPLPSSSLDMEYEIFSMTRLPN
jgi:hypothetical protein